MESDYNHFPTQSSISNLNLSSEDFPTVYKREFYDNKTCSAKAIERYT